MTQDVRPARAGQLVRREFVSLATRHLLFLSPHCDDAVFACGQVLEGHPGSVVATVCAGVPIPGSPLTEWDGAAGFTAKDEVMAARRAEDRSALSWLSAVPFWMDFRDSQYGPTHTQADLQRSIAALIDVLRPAAVFAPLGLFHSDHLAVHAAALRLAAVQRDPSWILYEDALYRRIPGLVARQLRSVRRNGFALIPVSFRTPPSPGRKLRAIQCYRSQLQALGTKGRLGHLDALAPECYWHLTCP